MTNLQHHKANGVGEPSEFESELANLKARIAQLEAAQVARSGGVEQLILEVEQLPAVEQLPGGARRGRGRPHMFNKLTRGDDLYRIYKDKDQRTRILAAINNRKTGRDDFIALILQCVDEGLLVENNICMRAALTLRTVFPWLTSHSGFATRFNLEQQGSRDEIRADVLPIAVANKDAVMADPELLEQLVYQDRQRRTKALQEQNALANLKAGECQIIIYGKMVWPRVDSRNGDYSYEQICAAARTFRDLDTYIKSSPKSRAIEIRNSTKWMRRFCASVIKKDPEAKSIIEKVYSLIHMLVYSMEENADGECRWPHTIHME